MYKLKKLPFITSTIALIIIILISAADQVSLNVLSMRIIIYGIIFFVLGLILKFFLSSAISEIETKKLDEENDNKLDLTQTSEEKVEEAEENDKNNKDQNEKDIDAAE